jgi:hypothetical protein
MSSDYFLLLEYLASLGTLLAHVTLYGYFELKWLVYSASNYF